MSIYIILLLTVISFHGFSQNAVIEINSPHTNLLIIRNRDTLPSNLRHIENVSPGIYNFEFGLAGFKNKKITLKTEAFDSIVLQINLNNDIFIPSYYRNYKPGKLYDKKSMVYFVVENMPQFPGGEEALDAYLKNCIKSLPKKRNGLSKRKIPIQFEVNENGQINVVRIVKGLDFNTDYFEQQLIWNMPQWKPGTHRGKPVRVSLTRVIKL